MSSPLDVLKGPHHMNHVPRVALRDVDARPDRREDWPNDAVSGGAEPSRRAPSRTRLRVRGSVPLLLLSSLASAAVLPDVDPLAHEAIVRAVRARLGATAEVTVVSTEGASATMAPIEDAVIEPGAVFGRPIRLLLRASVERGGQPTLTPVARVTVQLAVTADHWHTARAIARGGHLAEGDVRPARHVLASGPLAPMPDEDAVVGAAALRDLPVDACVTVRSVLPQPAVKAGDPVAAIVRFGVVEARASLVAIDGGRIGATVRVRHPETKRTMSATVTGRGAVEIQP